MVRNILVCHIMQKATNGLKEVGARKANLAKQEFTWNKRMWAIPEESKDVIWTDKKGTNHLMVDINEADGIIHLIDYEKRNLLDSDGTVLDKCSTCGDKISIDASNVRDLLKRKTVNAIWGIDNSYVTLLLLMGIVLVAMVGALFFVIGELNKTNNTLQRYLPEPSSGSSSVTANFIGALIYQ